MTTPITEHVIHATSPHPLRLRQREILALIEDELAYRQNLRRVRRDVAVRAKLAKLATLEL